MSTIVSRLAAGMSPPQSQPASPFRLAPSRPTASLPVASTPKSPNPPPATTPDPNAGLLGDYLNPALTFDELCGRHKLSPAALADWLNTPAIRARLALIEAARAERARQLLAVAQSEAVAILVRAMSSQSIESARRAATTLLRLGEKQRTSKVTPAPSQPARSAPPDVTPRIESTPPPEPASPHPLTPSPPHSNSAKQTPPEPSPQSPPHSPRPLTPSHTPARSPPST